jgi:biopolymer transport protein ExbD
MKKTNHSPHGTLAELNITPLLDLVFVLLVIFIITTPQMMNNLEMALPSAKPPVDKHDQPKPKLNKILVDEKGQIQLNGEVLALAALSEKLRRLKANDPALSVVVEGADDVAYQSMVDVLDLLRQIDITKVGLATGVPRAPGKLF